MKTLTLKRFAYTPKGVFGVLIDDDGYPFCVTMELPEKGNKRNVSCIPAGLYNGVVSRTLKHGVVPVILGVKDRTGILIHKGNYAPKDSLGCVICGEKFDPINGEPGVLQSQEAFDELMNVALKNVTKFQLMIVNMREAA